MKFIARVEGDQFVARWCRLIPRARRFRIETRPRLPLGELITVSFPGLAAPTDEAIMAWLEREYREYNLDTLRPQSFRPTVIGDFLDAVNALEHMHAVHDWNADAIAAFARDRGGDLLAAIRAEVEGEVRVEAVSARALRLAEVIGVRDAKALIDELAKLHAVEHLLGLEHAVARWIAGATDPHHHELEQLARALPDDAVSAGISEAWFQWWWRLARACTRADLMAIVERMLALADETCTRGRKQAIASEARDEARRMADRMADARVAQLWTEPPDRELRLSAIPRDERDAHYAAFMAVSHAAHAIAHVLGGHLDAAEANRGAMQLLAEAALASLREPAA